MPTVAVTTAASPSSSSKAHPKLTLATAKGARVVLPFAPVEAALTGIGHRWEEVERQGLRAPLLVHAGPQLARHPLEVNITNTRRPDDSIELYLYALAVLARGTDPVWVSNYGTLVGNAWRITDLAWTPYRRQPGTNAITGAMVDIELTAANDLKVVLARSKTLGANNQLIAQGNDITLGTPGAVTYKLITVLNESAAALAVRYYGSSSAIPKLLALNGFRDPRQIKPGVILKVPR